MKDISQLLSGVFALPPAVYAADNTPAAVDLADYNAAALYLLIGVGGITFSSSNKIEFKLTHSDDDSSYTAVSQADVRGVIVGTGGIIKALTAEQAAPAITEIGYVGGKQYLKLLADFSGTHGTGTPLAALVVKGRPRTGPAA
jgi:hypothetical protein